MSHIVTEIYVSCFFLLRGFSLIVCVCICLDRKKGDINYWDIQIIIILLMIKMEGLEGGF